MRQQDNSSDASQDTMQFIALANKNREQAAATSASKDALSANPGAIPGQEASNAGAPGSWAQSVEYAPRDDAAVERLSASLNHPQVEYHDFNIPYGRVAEHTEDGLIRHRHRRGERRRKITIRIVVAALVLLVIAVGAGGFALFRSAMSVKGRASTAVSLVTSVRDKVTSGEFPTLPQDAAELSALCADLEAETSGPLWQIATFVPVVGGDVSAARELVSALADVSSETLVPMAERLSQATPGKLFADGAVNVSAVCAVVDSLAASADALSQANARVQNIGDTTISQVTELVDTAKAGFSMLDGAASSSERLAPVLPAMLGAEGTRSYLIVAQNNVELRANGGLGSHQGLVAVENGVLTMGEFTSTVTIPEDQKLPVSDEEQNLFNKLMGHMGMYGAEALLTPDYPRAASLITQMWQIKYGEHVDGVIAVDPVFLQYLLAAVGTSVTLPDGSVVDGSNAATVLMHDVYWNYPQEESDAIFSAVAGDAFDAVLSGIGNADMVALVSAFQRGCEEGRFNVWMEDPAEEDAIEAMGMAAAIPDADDLTSAPQAGVYLNNMGFSKMDWYLDFDVQVGAPVTKSDGSREYAVTVNLKNTLTAEEERRLPDYVGVHLIKEDGSIEFCGLERYIVYLYAPAGGSISDVQVTGDGGMCMNDGTHDGLEVKYGMIDLYDQESCTVTYTITVPAGVSGDLTMRTTPTCQEVREAGE